MTPTCNSVVTRGDWQETCDSVAIDSCYSICRKTLSRRKAGLWESYKADCTSHPCSTCMHQFSQLFTVNRSVKKPSSPNSFEHFAQRPGRWSSSPLFPRMAPFTRMCRLVCRCVSGSKCEWVCLFVSLNAEIQKWIDRGNGWVNKLPVRQSERVPVGGLAVSLPH